MKNILLFGFLIFVLIDVKSQNQNTLSIKTNQERIDIENECIMVYRDSTNSQTIEDIISKPFKSFNYLTDHKDDFEKKNDYWLAFRIKNISEIRGEWVLEFRDIPYLEILIIDERGRIEEHRAGTLVPASEKQMNSLIREAVIFTLQPHETNIFYIKFQYLFDTPTINAISVSDTKTYIKQTTIDNLVQGVFQGLLWMMLFYNLFLYISTREKSYLYFIAYVFSFALLMLYAFQYLQDFIFPENPRIGSYFGICVFAAFIF